MSYLGIVSCDTSFLIIETPFNVWWRAIPQKLLKPSCNQINSHTIIFGFENRKRLYGQPFACSDFLSIKNTRKITDAELNTMLNIHNQIKQNIELPQALIAASFPCFFFCVHKYVYCMHIMFPMNIWFCQKSLYGCRLQYKLFHIIFIFFLSNHCRNAFVNVFFFYFILKALLEVNIRPKLDWSLISIRVMIQLNL